LPARHKPRERDTSRSYAQKRLPTLIVKLHYRTAPHKRDVLFKWLNLVVFAQERTLAMIGIVLVAHGALADGLRNAAEMIVGPQERLRTVGMEPAAELDALRLVLADLMGGSPANASAALALNGVPIICGVNLPMLLEVLMNRDQESAQDLAQIALGAATEGIVNMTQQLTTGE
jgi:PTS system mannose-specific IIA component